MCTAAGRSVFAAVLVLNFRKVNKLIVEILQLSFESLCLFFKTFQKIIAFICGLLPELLELVRLISVFTPIGMIALYFGVPTFLVLVVMFLIKRVYHTWLMR